MFRVRWGKHTVNTQPLASWPEWIVGLVRHSLSRGGTASEKQNKIKITKTLLFFTKCGLKVRGL